MVIVPRDEKDGAEDTRVLRRKGRVVVPRNERDGTERAWNNADEQESTVKKGKGNHKERVRRVKESKLGKGAHLGLVPHLIFHQPSLPCQR